MPSPRRRAWILTAALLALTNCKNELDDKPATDPIDDPWVNAIETGDEEQPAVAAAPAEAPPVAADPVPIDPNALAAAEAVDPAPDPATGVIATPTPSAGTSTAAKSKPAAPGEPAADATDPAPAGEPTEAAVVEPTEPAAEPTPAPAEEPAQPAAPPPITIADFHGNYRFVGGNAQRTELEAIIEDTANTLPMAIRGIGRKRLTKTNPIDDTLDIVITGDKVQTIFESGFDATCVLDGPTIHWSNSKGDTYKVRVRSKGSKLIQVIEDDDGVKTTVFVLSADKQKLTVHHKIVADRLPEPMTYRLSYSRK
jgi:hypothetical protein